MKKTFMLEELDCANCAQKMENGIRKVDGVEACTVTFMTKKMVIEGEESKFDTILHEAKRIIKKLEPDVVLIEK